MLMSFWLVGPEEGKKGRSHGKKKLVIIALERIGKENYGRSYMQYIQYSTTKEFRPFFNKHIGKDTHIRTDNWKSCAALKNEYPNLEQIGSGNGQNFRELHIQTMNFKGWLRGIHHHCSKKHIQGYLNEYCHRFNRRNHLDTIFHKLIERLVISEQNEGDTG